MFEKKLDESLPPKASLVESGTNIIAATWIDDMGHPQKDGDDKIIYYNNE